MEIKRLSELDTLRGISIIGVLVLHSMFSNYFSDTTNDGISLLVKLFDWSVLSFFFCSGFLLKRKHNPKAVIFNASRKLLIPFFVYNLLYNILFYLLNILNITDVTDFSNRHFLLIILISPGFQLYFLWMLFLANSISGSIYSFFKDAIYVYIAGALCLIPFLFYYFYGFPSQSHGGDILKFPLYLSAFSFGFIASRFRKNSLFRILVSIGFVLVLVMAIFIPLPISIISIFVPYLLMESIIWSRRRMSLSFLSEIGKISGSIYLWHTPLLLPFLFLLLYESGFKEFYLYAACLILCLAFCVFMRFVLQRLNFPFKRFFLL